jgi:hypothetical protein
VNFDRDQETDRLGIGCRLKGASGAGFGQAGSGDGDELREAAAEPRRRRLEE